jgi:heptosyltransferase-1
MSSVLIIRQSSLGDIVHALAVVQDIRQHRPEDSVDWVAEEMFADLVRLNRNVRTVVPVSLRRWRHAPFARATWREIAAFRTALRARRYDVVIDLQEQVKGALIGLLARGAVHGSDRSGVREPVVTLTYRRAYPIAPDQHLIDRCRQLVGKALGYEPVGPPQFGLSAERSGAPAAAVPDGAFMVFIHSTSQEAKLWPEAHWRTLLRHFTEDGTIVVLPSGNADEMARGERLAQGIAGVRVDARRNFSETASLLAAADLVCGVDTGLIHLAAALGTPTIALFLASDRKTCGAARVGSNAVDIGGFGVVPSPNEVIAAARLMRRSAAPEGIR